MENKISKIFWANLTKLSFCLVFFFAITPHTYACMWFEDPESYRIAMFRAELPYMQAYSPFYYTPDFLNSYIPDPAHNDWKKNCEEWQKALNNNINLQDIEVILYKTSPDKYLLSVKNKNLLQDFEGNTFIAELLKPANAAFLEYLSIAKQSEYYNFMEDDPWEENADAFRTQYALKLIETCKLKVQIQKNPFLTQRYAFQLIRLLHQTGDFDAAIKTFDNYFGEKFMQSIVGIWALQHKALCLDNQGNRVEANYLYSKVFDLCDEKKLRVYLAFNDTVEILKQTLQLAQNNKEKACILALTCFHYPGPALDKIKEIYALDATNKSILPLIQREINKLEDWIFTPQLTENAPSFYYEYSEALKTNLQKDIQELRSLRDFLISVYSSSQSDNKAFLAVSIAHLYFIDDKPSEGKKYLALIPANAPAGVLAQATIENVLSSIYSESCADAKIQEIIFSGIKKLEKLAERNNYLFKVLYSLTNKLSQNFLENKMKIQAGLLNMQGQQYKNGYNFENSYNENFDISNNYYWNISWFDANCTPTDIEQLIVLIQKKDKTSFEKYLCQYQEKAINAYFDLLGTMYFRENNLEKAAETFAKLPDDFWQKTYQFKSYLNENPFIPKSYPDERKFNYPFSKKEFVLTLLKLKDEAINNKEKTAGNYLKLGHAFFNCSYWGNSWMMMTYYWTSVGADDIIQEKRFTTPEKYKQIATEINNRYKNASLAEEYYKKVLQSKPSDEIAAQAYYMLHSIEYFRYLTENVQSESETISPFKATWLRLLYKNSQKTEAFSKLRCSKMEDFASKF